MVHLERFWYPRDFKKEFVSDFFVRCLGFRDFVEAAFSLQSQLDLAGSGGSPDHIFSRCFQVWFPGALLR